MQRKIKAIAIVYTPHLSRAAVLFAAATAVCLLLYGVFLLEAVAHTASRTQAQRQVENLTSKLSTLEETYLASTRSLTLERAGELGYVTPSNIATVYVSDASRSLSLRTQ